MYTDFKIMVPTKDNSFCFYPFYALVFKSWKGGSNDLKAVAPCCMMHDTKDIKTGMPYSVMSRGELKGLSPYDIFHHKKFEELRKNLLNNKRDSRCSTCWNLEDKGIRSHRLYTVWGFPEEFKADLKEIDITLSNKCNLACRMCNVGSSHQLEKDVDKLKENNKLEIFEQASKDALDLHSGITPRRQKPRKPYIRQTIDTNHLIRWIYNNTEKIKILKASGGEPLYDNNILTLLKKFVRDGNSKDTELLFHTNGVLITDKIINLMNEFKTQSHSFSIDGVDSTYNYIRHKSDFFTLENTLKNWLKHSTNVKELNINFVLSALNLGNVIDFLEWIALMFHTKSIGINVFISEVRPRGRGTDIVNLPITYLETIQKNIINYKDTFEQYVCPKSSEDGRTYDYEIDKLLSLIEHAITNNVCDISRLYTEITLLDETRNQSYKNFLNPSLVTILENYEREID